MIQWGISSNTSNLYIYNVHLIWYFAINIIYMITNLISMDTLIQFLDHEYVVQLMKVNYAYELSNFYTQYTIQCMVWYNYMTYSPPQIPSLKEEGTWIIMRSTLVTNLLYYLGFYLAEANIGPVCTSASWYLMCIPSHMHQSEQLLSS